MMWKQLSSNEWVYYNTTTTRIISRVRKNKENWLTRFRKEQVSWVICRPSGAPTENAFVELESAKKYVEKYLDMYHQFVDFDKPII
jgi:hypothetical protein